MSWRGSVVYRSCGPLAWHVWVHALDPKRRRFYELGWGRATWQLWPPRSVLNPENEWTMPTDHDLLATILHCEQLLRRPKS